MAGVWGDTPVPVGDHRCSHWVDPPEILHTDFENINVYELAPVLVGLRRWACKCKESRVTITTDNMQVFFMIKSGCSKNHTCMQWLKEIFWLCVEWDIELEPSYIESKSNQLANTLCRPGYFSSHHSYYSSS